MSWIKIVGMGMVNSLGGSAGEVYGRLCADETGFRAISRFDSAAYSQKHAGQLSEELEDELRTVYPDDDLAIAMMMKAGHEALDGHGASGNRLGLVLATNFGPMETLEWAWRERLDTGALDEESFAAYGNVLDTIGGEFGCDGPRVQLSMSCASGAAAAAEAKDMIESGRADRVLILAYDELTEYCWCGLSNLRTITTDTMRPFDVHRSGTIFSEGAAAMVVSAVPGDVPHAWLSGAATNNNAFHLTAPRKEAEGSRQAMSSALADAGLASDAVDHICAHGTSTHANDETEAGAFRKLFGERVGGMSVSAHKSQLGHLLGAAGLTEAIVTVMAMESGVMPGTLNCAELDPACRPLALKPSAHAAAVRCAVTNSAGIGGNNASLVISRDEIGHASKVRQAGDTLYVRALGWVLPTGVGHGRELLAHPEWLDAAGTDGALAGFSARPYVSSVKGYLDGAGATMLSAFSLVKGANAGQGMDERRGICTLTNWGACASAFGFFEQLAVKGARFASPMVFPHGYANTAGNLSAIEFGYCGPHQVFFGKQDVREVLEFALSRLQDGTADEMLAGVYEASTARAIPDGWKILNGAVALRLALTPSADDVLALDMAALRARSALCGNAGAVADFIRVLAQ